MKLIQPPTATKMSLTLELIEQDEIDKMIDEFDFDIMLNEVNNDPKCQPPQEWIDELEDEPEDEPEHDFEIHDTFKAGYVYFDKSEGHLLPRVNIIGFTKKSIKLQEWQHSWRRWDCNYIMTIGEKPNKTVRSYADKQMVKFPMFEGCKTYNEYWAKDLYAYKLCDVVENKYRLKDGILPKGVEYL